MPHAREACYKHLLAMVTPAYFLDIDSKLRVRHRGAEFAGLFFPMLGQWRVMGQASIAMLQKDREETTAQGNSHD